MFLQSGDNFTCLTDTIRASTVSPIFPLVRSLTSLARPAIGLSVFSACSRFARAGQNDARIAARPGAGLSRLPNPERLSRKSWDAKAAAVVRFDLQCDRVSQLSRIGGQFAGRNQEHTTLIPSTTMLRRSESTPEPLVRSSVVWCFNFTVESACGRRSWPGGWLRYCARG